MKEYRKHNYLGHPGMQACDDLASLADKCFPPFSLVDTIAHSLIGTSIGDWLRKKGEKIHEKTLPR